ncbi:MULTISPECIES: hypothetical protein [unclassified Kitasatospora]|uniref:hypothetical protein n=1 Tax=unclassified Kitasatospora TaxID=2633591 RepID=UPI0006EBCE30|nr:MULTISPECIES: hypothetical protein [unclassified Kitasatospora]
MPAGAGEAGLGERVGGGLVAVRVGGDDAQLRVASDVDVEAAGRSRGAGLDDGVGTGGAYGRAVEGGIRRVVVVEGGVRTDLDPAAAQGGDGLPGVQEDVLLAAVEGVPSVGELAESRAGEQRMGGR